MSGTTPPPGDPNQPEYLHLGAGDPLGAEPPKERGKGRRVAVVVGGLAAVGLVGAGAWAWNAWSNQGPQPSESLPAGTLGYASIDIDPTGQQKVEAIGFLRKFPAFKDKVGLDAKDDVRKKLFELIQEEGTCQDLDYEDDVEPWLGERAAIAAVDRGKDEPAPVVVVQVKDEGKAEEGVEKLIECGEGSESAESSDSSEGGYAFNDGWMVIAETEKLARSVVEDAQESSLADDEDYKEWTDAAGDPGIVTMYAAPEAGKVLAELAGEDMMGMGSDMGSDDGFDDGASVPGTDEQAAELDRIIADLEQQLAGLPDGPQRDALESQLEMFRGMRDGMGAEDDPAESPDESDAPQDEMADNVEESLENFPGGAATLRFDDDDLELEMAYGQLEGDLATLADSGKGGDVVATLPATTAAAFGMGFSEGWGDALLEQLTPMLEMFSGSADEAVQELEAQTGLSLPEDLETLFGESAAIAVDGSIDAEAFENEDPAGIPLGIKIKGDPEAIEEVLGKIRKAIGPGSEELVSETEGDYVVVGLSPDYLEKLAEDGKLADEDAFAGVVPEAEGSAAVFYVNFDAEDWLDTLASELAGDDQEVVDNLRPLDSFGVSSWLDDDRAHALVKLTTD